MSGPAGPGHRPRARSPGPVRPDPGLSAAPSPGIEHGPVGERPGPHRGRHLGVLRVEIGEGGVEPGQPFPEAAPRLPQRLQRGRQRQRQLDVGVFPAPPERGAQVVDLDVGLLETLLIITARRRVKQRRPSPCSGRGGGRARRRPRRTRRVFPARTGAPSPAAGSGFGPGCRRRPRAICRPAG